MGEGGEIEGFFIGVERIVGGSVRCWGYDFFFSGFWEVVLVCAFFKYVLVLFLELFCRVVIYRVVILFV